MISLILTHEALPLSLTIANIPAGFGESAPSTTTFHPFPVLNCSNATSTCAETVVGASPAIISLVASALVKRSSISATRASSPLKL